MKLIAPNNIFSTILLLSIPPKIRPELIIKDSSLIANELLNSNDSIALIPSIDLIKHKDLFVSEKIAIGFDELVSNSYLYFSKTNGDFKKLLLKGDISSNEVILAKIVFKENYNLEPKIELDSGKEFNEDQNYLVSGNQNWLNGKYKNGISFSEQISDLLEFPYINYVLVSNDKDLLVEFHSSIKNINSLVDENFESILKKVELGDEINVFLKSNKYSLNYELTEIGKVGLVEQIKLLYFHQIIDDIFDIKFV